MVYHEINLKGCVIMYSGIDCIYLLVKLVYIPPHIFYYSVGFEMEQIAIDMIYRGYY